MKELTKYLYLGLVIGIAALMCLQAGAIPTISSNLQEASPFPGAVRVENPEITPRTVPKSHIIQSLKSKGITHICDYPLPEVNITKIKSKKKAFEKLFQQFKVKAYNILDSYEDWGDLMEELEKLRKENKRLKKHIAEQVKVINYFEEQNEKRKRRFAKYIQEFNKKYKDKK